MLKSLLRDKILLVLVFVSVLLKLFSLDASRVERYYTYGFYPYFSRLLRWLLGWIPFSFGDVVYMAAFVFLVIKAWKLIRLLAKRQVKEYLSWILFRKYLKLVLWIYLVFNIFWGLNYNRQGIATQLGLDVRTYTAQEIYDLASVLQQRLNFYAAQVDSLKRLPLEKNRVLFNEGVAAYKNAAPQFPFLRYDQPSIKASLFSNIGHYFGFTGYYNPFTAEAQLKTSVPVFIKPFIVCHEIGHQLGYAKENEANFVGFLSGRASANMEFRYSAYYDVYSYAMRELAVYDLAKAVELNKTVHPQVKKDRITYLQYLNRSRNNIEPVMSDFYDRYLKLNNQPKGKATYNEVVTWLIAYLKKYGAAAI
jgi:hypothetical protein